MAQNGNGRATRVPVDREKAKALVRQIRELATSVYGGSTNLLAAAVKDARLAEDFAFAWEQLFRHTRPLASHVNSFWQNL